ncbi:serine hydrolase [Leptolyngbya sp. CCY15150]|uniref:serine hydrolase n=1 Tax=Leptolyngbya sp. CCY15150 TaxID=2767772 RepID=UPI00195020EA|nr:serine hydrolase [Leptolyngbya sp. CCY15150]
MSSRTASSRTASSRTSSPRTTSPQASSRSASRTAPPRSPRPGSPDRNPTTDPRMRRVPAPQAMARTAGGRSPQPGRPVRRRSRPNPVLLYLVRLLILVVGIGAIVGTLLSVFNPTVNYAEGQDTPAAMADPADASSTSLGATNLASTLMPLDLNQSMMDLEQQVRDLTTPYPDLTPGVFVLDFETGNYLDINGRQVIPAASIIKIPILVAFFQDVDAGTIQMTETLTLTEADVAEGSGDLQFHSVGSEYSALETASLMIVISDNTATNMLIRRMGGAEALNQRFQSWGLENTILRDWLPDLEGTNTTTPYEMVELMTRLSRGELLSLRSRDRLFDIMRRTYTDTLIPAGVNDPSATIAHKTGDIGAMVGDVGTVDTPRGTRYGVAVMMSRPHNDSRAQELIRLINGSIYEYLTRSPQTTINLDSQTEATQGGQALPSEGDAQISTTEPNPN